MGFSSSKLKVIIFSPPLVCGLITCVINYTTYFFICQEFFKKIIVLRLLAFVVLLYFEGGDASLVVVSR
jgi:hypothetical protein